MSELTREVTDDPIYVALHRYAEPLGLNGRDTIDWSQCGLAKLKTPPVRKVHEIRRMPKQHLRPLSAPKAPSL